MATTARQRFAAGKASLQCASQYVPRTEEISMCPSQSYATIPAQTTCEVQHAQMAPRMGTRLARTVADHALHVRLLVLHDAFLWKARGRRLGTLRRYALAILHQFERPF